MDKKMAETINEVKGIITGLGCHLTYKQVPSRYFNVSGGYYGDFILLFRTRELKNYYSFTDGGRDLSSIHDLGERRVLLVTAIKTNEQQYYSRFIDDASKATQKVISSIPHSYQRAEGVRKNLLAKPKPISLPTPMQNNLPVQGKPKRHVRGSAAHVNYLKLAKYKGEMLTARRILKICGYSHGTGINDTFLATHGIIKPIPGTYPGRWLVSQHWGLFGL